MSVLTEINQKESMDYLPGPMPGKMADQYAAVEFSLANLGFLYQFRIFESPLSGGIGILVKEGSVIMKYLNVGDIVDMRYYPIAREAGTESFRTEIRHIKKDHNGRFRGHYFVALSILFL